jgi:hypothetical protein
VARHGLPYRDIITAQAWLHQPVSAGLLTADDGGAAAAAEDGIVGDAIMLARHAEYNPERGTDQRPLAGHASPSAPPSDPLPRPRPRTKKLLEQHESLGAAQPYPPPQEPYIWPRAHSFFSSVPAWQHKRAEAFGTQSATTRRGRERLWRRPRGRPAALLR